MRKLILLITVGIALAVAGCGGDDDETNTGAGATNTVAAEKPATTIAISMSEFKFRPANPELGAGRLEISATNKGSTAHELVLLRTDKDPRKLPQKGKGVSVADSIGEIPAVPAGESATRTFKLKRGNYVMVCNLPGHYDAGMYGTITVH